MPKISIVDSHLHLWDSHLTYSWLKDCPTINKTFALPELDAATKNCSINSVVFVQAECLHSQGLLEVEWVSKLAAKDQRIKGIVAFAPLENGVEVSSYLKTISKNPLVKGVRRLIQWEADPNFCIQPGFVKGVQLLADYNLSFDLCIKAHQFSQTIQLVKQCPKVQFILDHLGKPNIADKQFHPWAEQIKELAQLPNVACKISGLINEANPQTWQADDLAPYVYHAIDVFGFDRVMFGSDWPVLNLVANYDRWVETISNMLKKFKEEDNNKFFSENAQRIYLGIKK